MTGLYVRVVRDGKPETIEVEFLTQEEFEAMFKGKDRRELLRWVGQLRRACQSRPAAGAPGHDQILVVEMGPDNRMVVKCQPGAFVSDYQTGMMLAQVGRIVLEAIREASHGNPALMEQAMATMTAGFLNDMRLPDGPASVTEMPQPPGQPPPNPLPPTPPTPPDEPPGDTFGRVL